MEKFAVDLEKVLNEFEYNEERRQSGPLSCVRTPQLLRENMGALRDQPHSILQSAAIYRKPAFERINLADADFAASPPKSTGHTFNHGLCHIRDDVTDYHIQYSQASSKQNYSPSSDSIDSAVNSEVNTSLITGHNVWQTHGVPVQSDEKPDLLEYNSKTGDVLSNDLETRNQLPDLTTSVRTSNPDANQSRDGSLTNSLDLISSANEILVCGNIKTRSEIDENEDHLSVDCLPINEGQIFVEGLKKLDSFIISENIDSNRSLCSENGSFCEPIVENNLENTVDMHERVPRTVLINTNLFEYTDKIKSKISKNENIMINLKDHSYADTNKSNDNIIEINSETNVTRKEHISEPLPENKMITPIDSIKPFGPTRIIGFDNGENYSQSQLLEYLEKVEELNDSIAEEVTCSEKIPELPDVANTELVNSDSKLVMNSGSEPCTVSYHNKESILNTTEIRQVDSNSQYSISENSLSVNESPQSLVTDKNVMHEPDCWLITPFGIDYQICSGKLKQGSLKCNKYVGAVDAKQVYDESTNNLQQLKCCNVLAKDNTQSTAKDQIVDIESISSINASSQSVVDEDMVHKSGSIPFEVSSGETKITSSKYCKDVISSVDGEILYDKNTNSPQHSTCSEIQPHGNAFGTDNAQTVDLENSALNNTIPQSDGDTDLLRQGDCNNPAIGKHTILQQVTSFDVQNEDNVQSTATLQTDNFSSQYSLIVNDTNINLHVSMKPSNPFDEETMSDHNVEVNSAIADEKSTASEVLKTSHCSSKDLGSSATAGDGSKNNLSTTFQAMEEPDASVYVVENITSKNTPNCLQREESITEEIASLSDSSIYNSSEFSAKMIPIKQAVDSSTISEDVVESGTSALEERPLRPSSLELAQRITVSPHLSPPDQSSKIDASARASCPEDRRLGKIAPFWIPDEDAIMCMQCQVKFNLIRRRHHCRACGQVLCSKCCGQRARLEYMDFEEARVCQPCFTILEAVSASESSSQTRQPNPNNPMEYCSTIPPLQQVASARPQPPPSVMVPVGVLKREGRNKSDVAKQVMFSDGIRPGGDLTELDGSTEPRLPFRRSSRLTKRVGTPPGGPISTSMCRVMDATTHSFIPSSGETNLPPVVTRHHGEVSYVDLVSPVELNQPVVKFALNRNLLVSVKRVLLDCCVNRECWCFSSEGLACVGQDEIVFVLECLPQEKLPPKDVFLLINLLYQDSAKGSTVSEMSFTPAMSDNLFGSKDHGGFLYIRTSYQCTAQLTLPSPPYLFAVLVHRWETPWARLFPIRLMLRLGAEFRYYPCPLVSVRDRPPLYTDIGQTIINLLADFRKYSFTLPSVRGLVIHMEDRQTTIYLPRNRYEQVIRALNNSNDSVLAFGANLSLSADSHLVCMQSSEDENTYHTQAINIHNKPRKVTGASFVVFNGALKVPGLAGKSNIVEDGLMVQVPAETMIALRTGLRDMRDFSVGCGPNAEETVLLQWTADDTNFNIGVKSCIDSKSLDGVPSIRVHNGTDYSGTTRVIRWTEVFILQCEDSDHASEPLDISRLSESIAQATCLALLPLLDLLSAASLTTLAVRTTIHPDSVGYEAGSKGEKLPPIYMNSLDNELVGVLNSAAQASQDNPAVLELVFRVMEQG